MYGHKKYFLPNLGTGACPEELQTERLFFPGYLNVTGNQTIFYFFQLIQFTSSCRKQSR
jgi:hypothetical protein